MNWMSDTGDHADNLQLGGAIPSGDGPAFELLVPKSLPLPILISVPHAGRAYPAALLDAMREPEWAALRLEDRYVDCIGRDIAAATGAALLIARAPRAMLDLNRAPDDIDWGMVADAKGRRPSHSAANRRARGGLGLVPRRLPGLGELWKSRVTQDDIHARIDQVHRPYHDAASRVLEQLKDRWGAALMIDLHSMPPLKRDGGAERPIEFVLGDRFGASASGAISAHILQFMAHADRRIAHNRPYSGGYTLERQGKPRRGIHAVQLEVCRSIYLDAHLDKVGPRHPAVCRVLSGLVRSLADEVAALGDPKSLLRAAE